MVSSVVNNAVAESKVGLDKYQRLREAEEAEMLRTLRAEQEELDELMHNKNSTASKLKEVRKMKEELLREQEEEAKTSEEEEEEEPVTAPRRSAPPKGDMFLTGTSIVGPYLALYGSVFTADGNKGKLRINLVRDMLLEGAELMRRLAKTKHHAGVVEMLDRLEYKHLKDVKKDHEVCKGGLPEWTRFAVFAKHCTAADIACMKNVYTRSSTKRA
jgi:hypothetical protein